MIYKENILLKIMAKYSIYFIYGRKLKKELTNKTYQLLSYFFHLLVREQHTSSIFKHNDGNAYEPRGQKKICLHSLAIQYIIKRSTSINFIWYS